MNDDVEVVEQTTGYRGYFRVDRYRLKHRRFDGGWTPVVTREVLERGHAAAVLPYDPQRGVVMLVRQMRAPMLVAAGAESSLEAPAGILDSADPQECARREAMEECGLRLGPLEPVVRAWSMPGVSTETMDLFLAPYSADDRIAPGGGLAEEHEQIEVVETSCAELAALVDEGRLVDMKTLVLALSLRQRHADLFEPGK